MIRYYRCHGEALLEGFCMPGEGAGVGGVYRYDGAAVKAMVFKQFTLG